MNEKKLVVGSFAQDCFFNCHRERNQQAPKGEDAMDIPPPVPNTSNNNSNMNINFNNNYNNNNNNSSEELYELFCVVNHHGKIDSGHYTCFVKHASMWFKCDDAWVTKATAQQVTNSKGYLLFYLRKNLDYCKLKM